MDPSKLNLIACVNFPPVTLSQIVLDMNCSAESHDHDEINRSTAKSLCKQVLKLSTREIRKSIKSIILDWKEKSPRIYSLVRPDQCYFGLDEDFVLKNMKDILPQFFCHILSNDSGIYCESLCEFSRLIAQEIVSKINNRIGMMLSDTSEGRRDIPESLNAMIVLIGNITNCLRLKMCQCVVQQGEGNTTPLLLDSQEGTTQMVMSKDSCDIVYSTSQKAVMEILVDTSSITSSRAEDQDLHEDRGDQVRHGKSDDGNSDAEEDSDVISHSLHFGRTAVPCLSEPADDHKSPTLVATSSINQCDEEDQDPQEDMDEEFRVISHLRDSEESLNADDGNAEAGNSGDESSDEENAYDESADDRSADDGNCDAKEDSDHVTQHSRLGTTTVKPRLASEVRHPCEPRVMSAQDFANIEMGLVIVRLVSYTIKKAKVLMTLKDSDIIIKNLLEKAKQQIHPNEMSVTTGKNVDKIHKAVFKELLQKIGTAKEILKVMETQVADCIFIDVLRIQLTSPKKKGPFRRFFSSMGKFLRKRFRDLIKSNPK